MDRMGPWERIQRLFQPSDFDPSANVLDEHALFYDIYHDSVRRRSSTLSLETLEESP